jgi:ABC-type proline/glycine betaine transport system ATPase subunit
MNVSRTTMPMGKRQPPTSVASKTSPQEIANELRIMFMRKIGYVSQQCESLPHDVLLETLKTVEMARLANEIEDCQGIEEARAMLYRGFES